MYVKCMFLSGSVEWMIIVLSNVNVDLMFWSDACYLTLPTLLPPPVPKFIHPKEKRYGILRLVIHHA